MGYNDLSEMHVLSVIEYARKSTENQILSSQNLPVNQILTKDITNRFDLVNVGSKPYYCKTGNITITEATENHDYKKTGIGTGLILLGQPILKKRFVTQGSAAGTSIASKYLSKALPYKMPFKIYSINVYGKVTSTAMLGRGLGRLVPYVGWGLLAIDVIELLVEVYEVNKNKQIVFKGFGGGGSFGGGGACGYW